MDIVAYCRVSTNTDDQLNSLDTQKKFFKEFAKKYGYNLVKIYADEGISGTKLKKRKEFLKLMDDAEKGKFELVVVKDISRFSRNAVDFLQSVRKLKAMGIGCSFVNANLTSQDGEMILGTLALVAQEESANTSKRIKFSKKRNAENGKVPNIVFGYDKIKGDYFNLKINEGEAETVKRIFSLYNNENYGANKIAKILNDDGIKTKRGYTWSQNAITRILSNEIYIGKIVNGKEQIKDFLTGEREKTSSDEWMITDKPELKIIDEDEFNRAQRTLKSRTTTFKSSGTKNSTKHIFSSLIKCSECGSSFRRYKRQYKNTYISWVCNGRNSQGVEFCKNDMVISETDLTDAIKDYFVSIIESKNTVLKNITKEFKRLYKEKSENTKRLKDANATLKKLTTSKEKYMDMYVDGIITRSELSKRTKSIVTEIDELNTEIKFIESNMETESNLDKIINDTFKNIEDIISVGDMTNSQLKRVIDKMVVYPDGTVDIYLKLLTDIGLDQNVLFSSDRT